jgi:hypothetical protein
MPRKPKHPPGPPMTLGNMREPSVRSLGPDDVPKILAAGLC